MTDVLYAPGCCSAYTVASRPGLAYGLDAYLDLTPRKKTRSLSHLTALTLLFLFLAMVGAAFILADN